ncbi:MAG: ATP-binding protein [Patescibacteria group bacterium]|nr:ATP-binding protein [Patescibacteria group bacterium]
MELNLFALSGGFIALSSGVMAIVMFSFAQNSLHRLWGFFCISVFTWGLGGLIIGLTTDPASADFWWRITHVGIAFIPTLFLDFVYSFLNLKRGKTLAVFYIISIIFSILALFSSLLIANMRLVFGEFYYDSPPGLLYPLFTTYFFGLTIFSHYVLYRGYHSVKNKLEEIASITKTRIRYFFLGMLVSFAGGSLSFLPVYGIDIYPVTNFAVMLYPIIVGYAILRHRLFDIRVATAQGLIFLLWLFVGVRFILSNSSQEFLLNGGLCLAVVVLGIFLVWSINKEINAREEVEKLAEQLSVTNERQEGLLHFIGHEVKGTLAKDEGAFASLSEGDFGTLPETTKAFVTQALAESRTGAGSVENILKAANLKKGSVTYTKVPFDLKSVVAEAVEKAKPLAEKKGLTLSFAADDAEYRITGDKMQIGDHVLRNLIDNSINYTPSGSITVSLEKTRDKSLNRDVFVLKVKDTGIGITDEDRQRLFTEGGHGKDSQKINVHSTGYGLFIAKKITEEHGGTIRVESEGLGKGSTFIVEFPS